MGCCLEDNQVATHALCLVSVYQRVGGYYPEMGTVATVPLKRAAESSIFSMYSLPPGFLSIRWTCRKRRNSCPRCQRQT